MKQIKGDVLIVLIDKESKQKSKPFKIDTLFDLNNQIEFEPPEGEDYSSLQVKDFLFFKDDYDIKFYTK